MKILTAKQMARWDTLSIKRHKIPARRLMENAAKRCCEVLWEQSPRGTKPKVVILCGPGNNGGDGMAMAVLLRRQKAQVQSFFFGHPQKLSPEAFYFFQRVQPAPLRIQSRLQFKKLEMALREADWIVDALFGIGLNRPLTGAFVRAIRMLNRARGKRLAVDMPSGISGDTGEVLGEAVQADWTVTFGAPKWGQLQPPAWDNVGKLLVKPIGLSRKELAKFPALGEWVDAPLVQALLSPRSRHAHKGSGGRLLVLAGSSGMPGAGYLCSLAALRTGAGLVTWAMPEEAFKKIDLRYPEVMLRGLPSKAGRFSPGHPDLLKGLLAHADALALGPGWGRVLPWRYSSRSYFDAFASQW